MSVVFERKDVNNIEWCDHHWFGSLYDVQAMCIYGYFSTKTVLTIVGHYVKWELHQQKNDCRIQAWHTNNGCKRLQPREGS